jgi:putative resolvase
VERRDWLAGFGVANLEAALCAQGRRFVVADPGETSGVLVRAMIEVFTSMCAQPYGCGGARDRVMGVLTAARSKSGGAA